MKILILTTAAGNGHNAAANAIEEQYKLKFKDVEAKVMDIYNPGHKFLSFFNNEFYFFLLRTFPHIMRIDYRLCRQKKVNRENNGSLLIGLKSKDMVSKEIDEFQPDAIICTHPYAVAVMSYFKKTKQYTIPCYFIITDYCLLPDSENAYNMDGIFTSCEEVHKELLEREVSENLMIPLGIPVHDKFESKPQASLPPGIELDPNIFTALLMNGGIGLGRNLEIIKQLDTLDTPIQVIVINALHKRSQKEVARFIKRHPQSKLKIYNLEKSPYIYEFMANSDIFIGKAGGISITECIKMELPIYVPFYPPFHEIYNVYYLTNHEMAVFTPNTSAVAQTIKRYLDKPELLKKHADNMNRYKYSNSAYNIANYVYTKNKK